MTGQYWEHGMLTSHQATVYLHHNFNCRGSTLSWYHTANNRGDLWGREAAAYSFHPIRLSLWHHVTGHLRCLLGGDNGSSVKAVWTSKSTFISMTLNSLPLKDKSPFKAQSCICQCHCTKERGNLFMPNMPPVYTFGRPFEHYFLIERGSLSCSSPSF